ncbi:MAG: response regulator [Chitinispirillales bacterium]|jgi:CheY-like chemotaxis protein|nr:response regulator [Chitinispirillales bacterium]
MRLSRQQLLSISGLDLSGLFDDDSDGGSLDAYYCGQLSEFVEKFPVYEADFKRALFIGDNETLSDILTELSDRLVGIHAVDLVQECEQAKESVGAAEVDSEKLESDLLSFWADVATLSVDIQMEQYRAAEDVKPKTRRYPAVIPGKRFSVLVVDDISVTLNLMKAVVQDAGYDFHGVTSGAAAMDFISKFTPDLFILDIEMPNMSGFELAAMLRENEQCAPIIFLTGNTTREYLHKAVKAGAIDFIVKPVNPYITKSKIKKVLG